MNVRILALSVLTLTLPAAAGAQGPVEELSGGEMFGEPFSQVVGVRELSDGAVLVADRTEKAVYRVDFGSGFYEMIGRNGQGPREYDTPSSLFALPGDSTLLVDFGNFRIAAMDADGNISDTWPLSRDGGITVPSATDAAGHVYFDNSNIMTFGPGTAQQPDSASVNRWDRASDEVVEVAQLARPSIDLSRTRSFSSGGANVRVAGSGPQPFQSRDSYAVTSDGSVAVVRASEYRVDWFSPDGDVRIGPAIEYERYRVTRGDKEDWADRVASRQMTMRVNGQSRTVSLPRPDIDETEFPEYFPAFQRGQVYSAGNGEVWVERYVPVSENRELYDVFDRRGNLIKRVWLPEDRQLVGLGERRLYATIEDQDGLKWLERYEI